MKFGTRTKCVLFSLTGTPSFKAMRHRSLLVSQNTPMNIFKPHHLPVTAAAARSKAMKAKFYVAWFWYMFFMSFGKQSSQSLYYFYFYARVGVFLPLRAIGWFVICETWTSLCHSGNSGTIRKSNQASAHYA